MAWRQIAFACAAIFAAAHASAQLKFVPGPMRYLVRPPQYLVGADINADGRLDLVVTDGESNQMSILVNDADGQWRDTWIVHGGRSLARVVVADDGGCPDLAAIDDTAHRLAYLSNSDSLPCENNFYWAGSANIGFTPVDLGVGRFDDTGKQQLVTTNRERAVNVVDVTKRFACDGMLPGGRIAQRLAIADFNGDGLDDVVTLNQSPGARSDISLFLNDGTAQFCTATTTFSGLIDAKDFAIGDFNGDGVPDLVVVDATQLLLFLNRPTERDGQRVGSAVFDAARREYISCDDVQQMSLRCVARRISVGDYNGDGSADVAVLFARELVTSPVMSEQSPGELIAYMHSGSGGWSRLASLDVGADPVDLVSANFDEGSSSDLAIAEGGSRGVQIVYSRVLPPSCDGCPCEDNRQCPSGWCVDRLCEIIPTPVPTPAARLCSGGAREGESCMQDRDCISSCDQAPVACITAQGICNGADGGGALCECAGGYCNYEWCSGGSFDHSPCGADPEPARCPYGSACVLAHRFCSNPSGATAYCASDDECAGSECIAARGLCGGGTFAGAPCASDVDCWDGRCVGGEIPCAATPTPLPGQLPAFECNAGPKQSAPCNSDGDCFASCPDAYGACVVVTGVCEGGRDDGAVCACPEGICEAGVCTGGAHHGRLCADRGVSSCRDSAPCASSHRVCAAGANAGARCVADEQCPGGTCSAAAWRCNGGDQSRHPCASDADCPGGHCSAPRIPCPPERFPPTKTPLATPTRNPDPDGRFACAGGSHDGDLCTSDAQCFISCSDYGACVLLQAVCASGDFEGFLCDCANGTCVANGPGSAAGYCNGGNFAGDACNTTGGEGDCGGANCVATQKICAAGDFQGFGCQKAFDCDGAPCVSSARYCDGGDFANYACLHSSDCNDVSTDGVCRVPVNRTCAAASPTPALCAGDCDQDGVASIDELVRLVNFALADGTAPPSCPAADTDRNGAVDIVDIGSALSRALNGCDGNTRLWLRP